MERGCKTSMKGSEKSDEGLLAVSITLDAFKRQLVEGVRILYF